MLFRSSVDVTERKLVEHAMRAISSHLLPLEGVAYYRAAAAQIADLLQADRVLILGSDPERVGEFVTLAEVADGKVRQGGEGRAPDPSPDGERHVAVAAEAIRDNDGRSIGRVAIARRSGFENADAIATTLKIFGVALGATLVRAASERKLAAARAALHDAVESMNPAVLLCDKDDRVVVFNQFAARHFGLAHGDEAIGRRFEDVYRAALDSGAIALPAGQDKEQFVALRMAEHRAPTASRSCVAPQTVARWRSTSAARTTAAS